MLPKKFQLPFLLLHAFRSGFVILQLILHCLVFASQPFQAQIMVRSMFSIGSENLLLLQPLGPAGGHSKLDNLDALPGL